MGRIIPFLAMLALLSQWASAISQETSISVRLPRGVQRNDTLILRVWPEIFSKGQLQGKPQMTYESSGNGGRHSFRLPDNLESGWISLDLKANGAVPMISILRLFPVEQGDDVAVSLTKQRPGDRGRTEGYDAVFQGQGAVKYSCMWIIRQATHHRNVEGLSGFATAGQSSEIAVVEKRLAVVDSIFADVSVSLNSKKKHLSSEALRLLELELFSWHQDMVHRTTILPVLLNRRSTVAFRPAYADSLVNLFLTKAVDPRGGGRWQGSAFRSGSYLDVVVDYERYRAQLSSGLLDLHGAFGPPDSTCLFRQRLLINALRRHPETVVHRRVDKLIEAYGITDPYSVALLDGLWSGRPGSRAYDFSLRDEHGRVVRLSDHRGKLVFMDFWFGACAPCQVYYRDVVKPVHALYRDEPGIVFISICTDGVGEWQSMLDKGVFTSREALNLCTDGKGGGQDVLAAYQVFAYPKPVLVGVDGTILHAGESLKSRAGLEAALEAAMIGSVR